MRQVTLIRKKAVKTKLALYLMPLGLIFLADSIMSYTFPVIVETHLNSNILLGIVMSVSSITGITFDLLIPKIFPKDSWKKMLVGGILISALFPTFTVLGTNSAPFFFFLLASITWGIYYELISFTQQDFVVNEEPKSSFAKDWGLIAMMLELAALVGSILGATLLTKSHYHYGFTVISIQTLALVISVFFLVNISRKRKIVQEDSERKMYRSIVSGVYFLVTEVKYWRVLLSRLFPIILVILAQQIVISTYWTFGGLFGESLATDKLPEWIVMGLFTSALLLGNLTITAFKVEKHKKKISQTAILISGTLLSTLFFTDNQTLILPMVFLSSYVLAMSFALNEAVLSDISERSREVELYILSLARATVSLVYIAGPLLLGFVAEFMDYQSVFGLAGILSGSIALGLLFSTPKKIKLPQKELHSLEK
jgi:MFS family permease